MIPLYWLKDVCYSLIKNKSQLIVLQVTYKKDSMPNMDDEGRIIIIPHFIQGGWQEASQWLSENYPTKESCQHIKNLDCSKKLLTGCLDLSNFPRLKTVDCSNNYLTELVIPKQAQHVNASSNNITSLSNLEVNWEAINLDLNNNPLNITGIIATIKSLYQNAELDRTEIEKFKKQLEISKQNLQTLKDNHKNNIQILKKEHQEQIAATQETIQELDKKLTETEEELVKKISNKNSDLILTSENGWWPKVKVPTIMIGVVLIGGIFYYFCRKCFF